MDVAAQKLHARNVKKRKNGESYTCIATGTRYSLIHLRVEVDKTNTQDIEEAKAIQENSYLRYNINKQTPEDSLKHAQLTFATWDKVSLQRIRSLLKELKQSSSSSLKFGVGTVDKLHGVLSIASGFRGMKSQDMFQHILHPTSDAPHSIAIPFVPTKHGKGFWSITVYSPDGYMFSKKSSVRWRDSKNLLRPKKKIFFGSCEERSDICLDTIPGWFAVFRVYKPAFEVLTGMWKVPSLIQLSHSGL